MKLSFVIPAHNEEYVLGTCLSSIQAALAATPCEAEIIVVNNASTDRTREIAASFEGVRVVDESRKGIVWARKAGYEASTGSHIANIDADTKMPAEWLPRVLYEFERDSKLIALSGPYLYYDAPGYMKLLAKVYYVFGYAIDAVSQKLFNAGGMLQGGNYVVTREALDQIGGFDTRIAFYGEDVDIAQRMRKVGKVKWTFKLPMYSSARRFVRTGVFKTGLVYALNYLWISVFKRPLTTEYSDIRIPNKPTTGR